MITAIPRRLATRTSAPVTSRTWVTPPGEPSASAVPIGLHRVDHQQRRLDLLDVAEHRAEVGLGGQVQLVGQRVRPAGPQPDLGGGLLAGDVQRASAGLGPAGGDLEQQGRLADARLAGEQHHRAGHQPAAEHPVQLADPGQGSVGRVGADLADRHRLAGRRRRRDRGELRRAGLRHAAPGLALAAPPDPAHRRPAALACTGTPGLVAVFAMPGTLTNGTDTPRQSPSCPARLPGNCALVAATRRPRLQQAPSFRGGKSREGQRSAGQGGGDLEDPGVRLGVADGDPDPSRSPGERAHDQAGLGELLRRARSSPRRSAARRSCPGRRGRPAQLDAARRPADPDRRRSASTRSSSSSSAASEASTAAWAAHRDPERERAPRGPRRPARVARRSSRPGTRPARTPWRTSAARRRSAALQQLQSAQRVRVVRRTRVSLVEHDQHVVGHRVDEGGHLGVVQGRPGRVVRGAEQHRAGRRADRGAHRGQIVHGSRTQRHLHCACAPVIWTAIGYASKLRQA